MAFPATGFEDGADVGGERDTLSGARRRNKRGADECQNYVDPAGDQDVLLRAGRWLEISIVERRKARLRRPAEMKMEV